MRKVFRALLKQILRWRLVGPGDEWLLSEVDAWYRTCRFDSKTEPFLVDPEVFDSLGDYRAQIAFLAKRHGLAETPITVYMHGELKRGSRRCAGLAYYPFCFDTSRLGANERLLSVNSDGSYAAIDSTDPERSVVRPVLTPISLSAKPAAIFIDQAFVNRKAGLAGIIAHEIAHLYLYQRGVHKPSLSGLALVEEYRTDIAVFAMGLGRIAIRAAAIDGIGYLSHRQMLVAQKRILALMSTAEEVDTPR